MIRRIDEGETNEDARAVHVAPPRVEASPSAGSPVAEFESQASASASSRASGRTALVERVRRLLEIVPGERRLLPDFGCGVHRLADPGSPDRRAVASALVEEAIERWLPEMPLERADVLGMDSGQIRVEVVVAGRRVDLEIRHRPQVALTVSPRGGDSGRAER